MLNYFRTVGIFKDVVLCRVKAYNAVALATFLLNDFDKFFSQKLIEVAGGRRLLKTEWLRYKKVEGELVEIDTQIYEISSPQGSDKHGNLKPSAIYIVDMNEIICSCPFGKVGRICKHLVSFLNLNSNLNSIFL